MTGNWHNRFTVLNSHVEQLEDAVNELRSLSEKGEDTAALMKRISFIDEEIKNLLKEIK